MVGKFRNSTSISSKIVQLLGTNCNSPAHVYQIQAQLIIQNLYTNTTLASHFISACRSLGLSQAAFLLYTLNPQKPQTFICNQLLRAFSHSDAHHYSISLYSHMHKNLIFPNNYTFPFILKSLSDLRSLKQGKCIHAQIVKLGPLNDIYVQNSLLNLYASCGDMVSSGYVFDEMPHKDVVTWTVVITGYRECSMFKDALIAFEQMQNAGVEPNQVTMVNALAACASFGALDMGVWIHEFIKRKGWTLDVILGTALINMYGKCGRIEEGLKVFKSMEEKNVFTWNALIKGFALAENGQEAVMWFSEMEREGANKPNEVTLIAVLCACVHSGLVKWGEEIFSSLLHQKYGFSPGVKHYACMIDLLARDGRLEDALRIIDKLPFQSTKTIWGAFFSGCRVHGNLELSEVAARKLVDLEPEICAYYVVLSNLYAEMGRWDDVEEIRRLMKNKEFRKDSGYSSIELEYLEDVSKWLD
nr:pentatricopeptide repeat-containing protein At5g66520-like [Coffea arabica]